MASMSSLTRTALPHLVPDPEPAVTAAVPLPLAATGDGVTTGDGTGHHHHHLQNLLHPTAGLPLAPGPVPTLVATDVPPAVVVTTIADMAAAATTAPHHGTTGPTLAPTAAHPCQTGTRAVDTTGPAPSLHVV